MRYGLISILLFFCLPVSAQFQGLVVNEFSQGDQGSREYIELLVVGNRTCNDSTANIRGWIVDDQNGWYGTGSLGTGHYRFKNVPNWAAVPFGAIILLYNSAANNKNNSIALADDPTDADKDLIYVVPINSSAFLEEYDTEPSGLTGASYIYPPAASNTGYTGTSNLWTQHIALNNGSDVICTVSPQNRAAHYFSIGYGYPIVSGYRNPSVSVPAVNAGNSCYLTDDNYTTASSWAIAAVPLNETPGLPNGGINTTWIQAMRITPAPLSTYTTACSNGPYVFFSQTLTNTGAYTVLANNANGCVDTNRLYVVIKKTETIDTTACDSLIYNGIKYTSNTTIVDKISSTVINCDSLVRTLRITIKKSTSSLTNACAGIGQSYTFNGTVYSSSGSYGAVLVNSNGCDSIAKLFLVITSLQTTTVSGCGSVVNNGVTYTSSTLVFDTVKSIVTGCDSVIKKTAIQVNQPKSSYEAACANDGDTYNFNGQLLTASGLYSASLASTNGCDSLARLYIVFKQLTIQTFTGCDSVVINGVPYYQSAVQSDTVKSIVSGCDSLISLKTITVNHSKTVNTVVCSKTGGYNFFGQILATGGYYSHTLTTANGCDSIVNLYLVITDFQSQIIRGCDSVPYNGNTYFSTTNIADTIASIITGCDSIVRSVQIIVNPVIHSSITACIAAGQSYTFNGQVLTTTGNYNATYSTNNCDSIVHLYLMVTSLQMQTIEGCGALQFNGISYTTSTTLRDTIKSLITGCDSIQRTINIVVNPLRSSSKTVCIKEGDNYNFNGQLLTATGNYSTTYSLAGRCDSTVYLYLLVSRQQVQNLSGCDSLRFNGNIYTSSATLRDTIRSVVSACDSIYQTINIVILLKPVSFISACIRQGQAYNFNGQMLTATGDYVTVYLTMPCDSIVHLKLIVARQEAFVFQGCSSYTYNGITYTSSILLQDTIRSVTTGCDSILRSIQIIITTSIQTNITACIQQGQSYLFNNQILTAGGNYTAHLKAQEGCDSTVRLYLTVASTQIQNYTGCDSLQLNGKTYYASTQVVDTVSSLVSACDSMYKVINVTINTSPVSHITVCLPALQTYLFNGQLLTNSGQYTATFLRPGSCDSIVRLHLIITSIQTQAIAGCDSVIFKGKTYSSSTLVSDTIRSSVAGCDSIISITNITVSFAKHKFISVCLPPGQTYNFNGQVLNSSGSYQTTYSAAPCDSIVHLQLVIARQQTLTYRGCRQVVYNGVTYTSSAILNDTVKSIVSGCDSIYQVVQILIQPLPQSFTNACIADGGSYLFDGQVLTSTGNYNTTYTTAAGCDSIVHLYLVAGKTKSQTIAGCGEVVYKGVAYTASTVLADTIKSVITQCDSLITIIAIKVNQKPVIEINKDTMICKWDKAILTASSPGAFVSWMGWGNGGTISVSPVSSTTYTATALDTNGCANTAAVTVSVQDFSLDLSASANAVLSGSKVTIQSGANLSYTVMAWQPQGSFTNQSAKTQQVYIDTSVTFTAVANSLLGCRDTANLQIVAMALDDIYIPSGFTPNGDGKNEVVRVMGTAIKELDFKVFNRWGQMIFYTTEKGKGWDGKLAGALQPAGTYVYVVRVKKTSGQVIEKKGTVTLIR